MYINKAAVTALGNLPYIQFLWDEGNRVLLLKGAARKQRDTLPLERFIGTNKAGERRQYVFQRKVFMDALNLRMRWDVSDSYRVIGDYVQRLKMVAFRLSEAEKLDRAKEGDSHAAD
jgi:hypothetical protein